MDEKFPFSNKLSGLAIYLRAKYSICTKADAFMQMAISPCGAVPVLEHRFIGRGYYNKAFV
jgi:hypothetical protein